MWRQPRRQRGLFHEPTILTSVAKERKVAYEETVGPIALIFTFGSEEITRERY